MALVFQSYANTRWLELALIKIDLVNIRKTGLMTEIGIVVPTIGQRPEYLPLALKSIREAGSAYILLVGNKGFDAEPLLATGLIDKYIDEQDHFRKTSNTLTGLAMMTYLPRAHLLLP